MSVLMYGASFYHASAIAGNGATRPSRGINHKLLRSRLIVSLLTSAIMKYRYLDEIILFGVRHI